MPENIDEFSDFVKSTYKDLIIKEIKDDTDINTEISKEKIKPTEEQQQGMNKALEAIAANVLNQRRLREDNIEKQKNIKALKRSIKRKSDKVVKEVQEIKELKKELELLEP